MKKDCPLLKNKGKFKSKKFKKKKDYQASWKNSDFSSSDEEEATKYANICYMVLEEDEVQYTELLDTFHELYNDLKNEKIKNKILSKENEKLIKENSCYASHIFFYKFSKRWFWKNDIIIKKR